MFILKITKPCHQNWEEMLPEQQGKFCGACQKTVVDFTEMSDDQVKNFLLDSKNKNTCGRFYKSQIGRPLENQKISINEYWYRKLPFSRQLFYAVAIFFILGVSSCDINNVTTGKLNKDTAMTAPKSPRDFDQILGETISVQPDSITQNVIGFSEPAIHEEQALSFQETNMGVPEWKEPIDTATKIIERVAIPNQTSIDTAKKEELYIIGDIAVVHESNTDTVKVKK